MVSEKDMKKFLVGKEKVEDESKFLVSSGSKAKECEKCGADLPEDTPFWKKLCKDCRREKTFNRSDVRDIFDRNDESSFVENKKVFDGVEDFWKRRRKY